jgi:hypothetical protein
MRGACLRSILLAACAVLSGTMPLRAQVVQPVIAEYTKAADGYFQVKNEGTAPQIVTLEPRSFSLDEEGNGIFRPLDPTVHLELSATSVRLEPRGAARIFYKVNADALPAWLCIYANFSPAKEGRGVNVRIMLPHTIYLYGKEELQRSDVVVTDLRYDENTHRITASVENRGRAAGRVAEVAVNAGRASQTAGGFPLLPGGRRNIAVEWTSEKRPEDLNLRLAKFDLKLPLPKSSGE